MSFLGLGRAQPTSAEKIAAVENELKVMSEMHSRYVLRSFAPLYNSLTDFLLQNGQGLHGQVHRQELP